MFQPTEESERSTRPTSEGAGRHLFLSYSRTDEAFVEFLYDDIRLLQQEVWLDKVAMEVGDSLIGTISHAITASRYVIAIISTASVRSNWVQTELAIAATQGIREMRITVLPLLLNGDDRMIPPFLSHQLYVDCRTPASYDAALAKLVRRIYPSALERPPGGIATILDDVVLTMDQQRAERLLQALQAPGFRDWVVAYLVEALRRPDPVERRWAYYALGEAGGPVARDAIKRGLADEEAFARTGAVRAWARIRATKRKPNIPPG